MNPFSKFRALFRKEKLDAEMSAEMRAHLELQTAENLRRGLSPDDARYAAQRSFGGVEQVKERCRDERARGWLWLEQFGQDVAYAVRALGKSRGFTAVAVLTLALGIGLTTLQFSFINGVLFKGLPFEGAERIMSIGRTTTEGGRTRTHAISLAQFSTWRDEQKSFARIAAHLRSGESFGIGEEGNSPKNYPGNAFSAGMLELLGVQPILGRGFQAADEAVDAPPVVLLGYHVWQNDFGADPDIVGRVIRLKGEPATIVGVMPEQFAFPRSEAVWVNLRPSATGKTNRAGMESASVWLVGRLREDTVLAAARAEMDVIMGRAEAGRSSENARVVRAAIAPFGLASGNQMVVMLYSLLGVVGGVLLLACLNVANLLTARALQRGRELAVRAALGATRGRIIRQMLTESCLLALLGALGGIAIAAWGSPVINRALATIEKKPFWIEVELDHRVLATAAGLTLVVGVLAGLLPALRATRQASAGLLKETTGSVSSTRLGRMNQSLVVLQVGVSCAVLLATSVVVDAMRKHSRVDLPFDTATTLTAKLRVGSHAFLDEFARANFQLALLERLRALPGVTAATSSGGYPLGQLRLVTIEARDSANAGETVGTYSFVAPGLFRDLKIALREGREFLETDRADTERVAIVNERMARQFWPGESALGKKFLLKNVGGATPPLLTVVGVSADVAGADSGGVGKLVVNVPLRQEPDGTVTVFVNGAMKAETLVRPLQDAVRALSVDVAVDGAQSVDEYFDRFQYLPQLLGGLALVFGLSGQLLAAMGIFALTSYAVQRRTREFGVRLAVGARPVDVLALVIKQGAWQLVIGLGAGAIVGWAIGQPLLRSFASGLEPPSWLMYAAVFSAMTLALGGALWWPARRVTKIDPMKALRAE